MDSMNTKVTMFDKPSAEILTLGNSGAGKDTVISSTTSKTARSIISRAIGETNSTLEDKLIILIETDKPSIIIYARLKDELLDMETFRELIVDPLVETIVASKGNSTNKDLLKIYENNLKKLLGTKVNSKAALKHLNDDIQEQFLQQVVKLFKEEGLFEKNTHCIYHTAKNKLDSLESTQSSSKLSEVVKFETLNVLDQSSSLVEELNEIRGSINNQLKQVFFRFFSDTRCLSEDNSYYYTELDLENPDEEFVSAFFCNNDLRKHDHLSIEVLCKDIVISVPMHPSLVQILKKREEIFMNSHKKISIAFKNTRGFFHTSGAEKENEDYLKSLVYNNSYTALMFVMPMYGDINAQKSIELYKSVLEKLKKEQPIFVLQNKADLFAENLSKNINDDDDDFFSLNSELAEISPEQIRHEIKEHSNAIKNELNGVRQKTQNSQDISVYPCCFKPSSVLGSTLSKELSPSQIFASLTDRIGGFLEQSSFKLHFEASPAEQFFFADKLQIATLINEHLKSQECIRTVLVPGKDNIEKNTGKVPHGNGWRALGNHASAGEGWTSNIDTSWYICCNSFDIRFPSNLENFITDNLIDKIVRSSVKIQSGNFASQDEEDKFIASIAYQLKLSKKIFVKKMVWDRGFRIADLNYSYASAFKEFLILCTGYFDQNHLNVDTYVDSLYETLAESIDRTVQMHVLYQ